MGNENPEKNTILDTCPHCGQKLSPWQQVLLSVDRALMCKNCWYKINLDLAEGSDKPNSQSSLRRE